MLSPFLGLPVCRRLSLQTGEGERRWGEEPNHTTARKPGPLLIILYSLAATYPDNNNWIFVWTDFLRLRTLY
jgi:hypothetical protein